MPFSRGSGFGAAFAATTRVHSLSRFTFGLFLSVGGLFTLAALESTIFFWFPFGIDAAVIVMTVRHPNAGWEYPIAAAAGSLVGTIITFWMGKTAGEAGLEKYVPQGRLHRVQRAVQKRSVFALAILGLIPPPFPFTAFVLAAGALEINATQFLGALAGVRLARFGIETLLAHRFGTSVLAWLNSDLVMDVVSGIIGVAIVGSIISAVVLWHRRSASKPRHAKRRHVSKPRRARS